MFFVAAVLCLHLAVGSGYPQSSKQEASLRKRIAQFWDALEKRDLKRTDDFVASEDREFIHKRLATYRVYGWKIVSLQFNSEETACDVSMKVSIPTPLASKPLEWPVANRWVRRKKTWYLYIDPESKRKSILAILDPSTGSSGKVEPPRTTGGEETSAPSAEPEGRLVPMPGNPSRASLGEKALYRFRCKNDGTKPIKILSVKSECGCVHAAESPSELAPGESAIIEVALDTSAFQPGDTIVPVWIQFSDSDVPVLVYLSLRLVK